MKFLTISATTLFSAAFFFTATHGNIAHAIEDTHGQIEPLTAQCNYIHNDDLEPYHKAIVSEAESCPEAPEPVAIHAKIGPHDCTIFIFRM